MASQVSDCLKSPIRASGDHFRINMLVSAAGEQPAAELVISVPKRWVKRAIDRNTIKRLGRVWWSGFVRLEHPVAPRMAFVQISPKLLQSCRDKRQGALAHALWKQQLAQEFQRLGERLKARCAKVQGPVPHQPHGPCELLRASPAC
ncbi:ribonuclease P protein component [Amphibiibacter pelophylacis]|uniref:Ribonuclease P protein component n=1 Tax=Amphibiibacter pelophylacis TaxID=1799477 RepID=A0ACC6P1R7_9BURK